MPMPIPNIDQLCAEYEGVESLDYVARGGFKLVYRATFKDGHEEALKAIYLPSEEEVSPEISAQLVARAKREIAALDAGLSDSLVRLGSLPPKEISSEGSNYLVYSEEFLPGNPLSDLITKPPTLPYTELWTIFNQFISLIEDLWSHGYLHRDIKPANIISTGWVDRPYVALDLGIAYKMTGTQLTLGPTPPGTVRYMPPEMLEPGYKDVADFRSDLYSLGISIYELACGENPYAPSPADPFATRYKIMTETPAKLETFRPDLPLEFCRIVDRCMKKKIALRYSQLSLLKATLEGVQP